MNPPTLLAVTTVPAETAVPESLPARRWRTVEQLAVAHPAFTVPAIRALIQRSRPHFNSHGEWVGGNGLAGAICQLGGKHGRVLIDELAFAAWMERWTGDASERAVAA